VNIHWIGTSFGVTKELFKFWQKNEMQPVYLRQTANELTGEYSCLMIKPMTNSEVELPGGLGHDWLTAYTSDFKRRMLCLLGFEFRNLSCGLAYSFMSKAKEEDVDAVTAVSPSLL
jgi:N-acetyltransferase 10